LAPHRLDRALLEALEERFHVDDINLAIAKQRRKPVLPSSWAAAPVRLLLGL